VVVEFSRRKTFIFKKQIFGNSSFLFLVIKQKPNTIPTRIRDLNGIPVVARSSKSADEEADGEMGLESIRRCLGLLFGAPIGDVVEEKILSVWKGLEDRWLADGPLLDPMGVACPWGWLPTKAGQHPLL
jgi:hypothetical protein